MIYGTSGAGKSTLARELGNRLNLPVHYMDHIHWLPNWVMRDEAEKMDMVREIVEQDAWVFEGGHSKSLPLRLARAEMVIWLDINVVTRLRRVIWRALRTRGQQRPDLPEGCIENLGPQFFELLSYIIKTRRRTRERGFKLMNDAPEGVVTVHLRSPKAVRIFLTSLHIYTGKDPA
ncbi:MAG: AAA family ATPase [Pseudomonadota bacterium]